ncbi:hypothetical protein C8R44DRAFT_731216 [Mycena epipterygia]|nr:hypothetical protein C8R44DRAFT_731216 [Mycena epipterygia]
MSSSTEATSHASRNPTKEVQEARGRKKGDPLTPAQKATRDLKNRERIVNAENFAVDLDAFYAYRGKTTIELAAKYNRTPEYIKSLLINASQFKTSRSISLRNAIIHNISVNGRAEGKALKLPELHALADDVIANNPPSADKEERMVDALRAHRELKRVGARATNIAAAVDTHSTVADMQDEFASLYERTGTRGFGFFTRGHIDDAAMPTMVQSGDAAAFCIEVLKKPAVDILRLFEHWSVSRGQEKVQRDNHQSLCSQLSKLAEEKLRAITRCDTLSVSWVHMDVDMGEAWKVRINGWPTDIAMACPSKIKNIEHLRRLRDAWVSSGISWVDELAVDLAARRAKSSNGLLKKRKRRNDIGGTHKPSGSGNSKCAAKKAKHSKGKGQGRRNAEALDEEEEDDEPTEEDEPSEEEEEDNHHNHHTTARASTRSAAPTTAPLLATAAPSVATTAGPASPTIGATPTTAATAPSVATTAAIPITAGPAPPTMGAAPSAAIAAPAVTTAAIPITAGSFIAYTPLGDRSNAAPRKRKSVEQGEGAAAGKKARKDIAGEGDATKKPRKRRSDAGKPRASRASTSSPMPRPAPRRVAPGSGYKAPTKAVSCHRDDEVMRRIRDRLAEAERVERGTASLAAQLPPVV